MPTVTPYPTLTPFPTPAGTPIVNLAPVMDSLAAGQLGPQVIQWWQMAVAPSWALISGGLLIFLVMIIFFAFFTQFKGDD